MSKYISKGQDIFLSEFKKISEFLLVCLIMAIFVVCFVVWNRDIESKHNSDKELFESVLIEHNLRIQDLGKYKKSCIKKTKDQHEINMKILEYIKPALPESEFIELIKLVTGE